jgi:electron transfer flavoprotein beta subunit
MAQGAKPMKFAVLVKGVPDFREGKVKFKEDNTLDRGSTPTVLNPNDHLALQAALEAKVKHGGEVHLITMGPPNYKKILAEGMQIIGDRGVLCSDIKLGGADTLATAWTLSSAIKKIGDVDVVFAGFKSADGETGQTGPQTAWKLGWPVVTHVTRLELDPESKTFRAERFVYDEIEEVTGPLPVVIVTDPAFRPSYRKASHRLLHRDHTEATQERAKEGDKHVSTWTQADLMVDEGLVGLRGSPTIVRVVEPIPKAPSERKARVLNGKSQADIEEAARLIVSKGGGA